MIKKLIVCICLLLPTISNSQVIQQHNISDDGYAHIPLQFGFPYYGRIFTDSFMYSNGVVGFGSVNNSWCCNGFDLANARGYEFNFSIMPLQTDLVNYGQGRFLTEGTTQYQRYVWENISEFGVPGNLNTFGVEIRPSGYIGINYEKVNLSPWRVVTRGMTGDTSLGEYTQYYHGPGYSSQVSTVDTASSTGGNLCISNPLSSPSCPGYQEAFLLQQCTADSLYSPSCPGYAEAHYAQQCTLNALYDVNCPGYGVAYLNQQCSLSALYSPSCPGYREAYFTQQCNANQLYSRQCPGYNQAYALANVVPSTTTSSTSNNNTVVSTPQLQVSSTGTVSVETPVVADPVANEVITRQPVTQASNPVSTSRTTESVATNNITQAPPEPKAKEPEAKSTSTSSTTASTNSTAPKAKVEVKIEKVGMVEVPVMATPPLKLESVSIVDLMSKQLINAPRIKNDDRAFYLMMMQSQKLHEEMVNEQYRR